MTELMTDRFVLLEENGWLFMIECSRRVSQSLLESERVCFGERERERDRERERVWKCMCVCVCERERVCAGNTKGGSITVPLASCLTGLESAV
jgi:hypothetical protein